MFRAVVATNDMFVSRSSRHIYVPNVIRHKLCVSYHNAIDCKWLLQKRFGDDVCLQVYIVSKYR